MNPSHAARALVLLAVPLTAAVALVAPVGAGQAPSPAAPPAAPPTSAWSAISVVVQANGGRVPATGEQLAAALARIKKFAQLPVPFSAVRLESGLANPRVVITPAVAGLNPVAATFPNLDGRLFFAVNMDRGPGPLGDPVVTSVEFISWNSRTKRFDFGMIDSMGGTGTPQIRVVDGGKCFSCHKNRGPILGADPWSNTGHDDFVLTAMANRLRLAVPGQPGSPAGLVLAPGPFLRERIDGMALALPEGPDVDFGVRLGSGLRLNRDVFRAMTRTPAGRKALVALLVPVADGSPIDAKHVSWAQPVDSAMAPSIGRFGSDWAALQKAWHAGILADFSPAGVSAQGQQPPSNNSAMGARTNTAGGGKWGGSGGKSSTSQTPPPGSPAAIQAETQRKIREAAAAERKAQMVTRIIQYDTARSLGEHGLPSIAQPTNPRAFLQLPITPPSRASEVVNPLMLASTIGLTIGDRRFLAAALEDAVRRGRKPGAKVTAATLAKEVFEGSQFADVLAGGPLPDRDEFKDRFVAGLDEVLKTRHGVPAGYAPDRATYAFLPRLDPSAEDKEADAVPTTACLRCHDVRGPAKAPGFEPTPTLAFDPFDRAGRETWLAATPDRKARRQVLERMVKRLVTDKDMPPEDAPERDRFRLKEAAAFDEVKQFLDAELKRVK
jgi:hypothetical protein